MQWNLNKGNHRDKEKCPRNGGVPSMKDRQNNYACFLATASFNNEFLGFVVRSLFFTINSTVIYALLEDTWQLYIFPLWSDSYFKQKRIQKISTYLEFVFDYTRTQSEKNNLDVLDEQLPMEGRKPKDANPCIIHYTGIEWTF